MVARGPAGGAGCSLCIHGHFYQPPRENPWTGHLDEQPTAAPFHDWNERITDECYRANANARILAADGLPDRTVSNYSLMSFDFGPTLLRYLAEHQRDVYAAVLAADRDGRARFGGHGPAVAQSYSHAILPLCSPRDRATEVRWGLRDFELRFGRKSEGLWMPEAAVDSATLETLAAEGVRFTILAQRQAAQVRRIDGGEWMQVGATAGGLDTRLPYLVRLAAGRSITVFFYDGGLAHDVAFGNALADGGAFLRSLEGCAAVGAPESSAAVRTLEGSAAMRTLEGSAAVRTLEGSAAMRTFEGSALIPTLEGGAPEEGGGARLVHLATDGETFGHHHEFAEMGLAWILDHVARGRSPLSLTVYGQWLEHDPPVMEARLHERSSWSCIHGVERWRSDCGCQAGRRESGCQSWRGPLREALDDLRDHLAGVFERDGAALLRSPWDARDAYIELLLRRSRDRERAFLADHGRGPLRPRERSRVFELLEMQRHTLLMYASCAWFFDDLADIEPLQGLAHAARAIELAGAGGVEIEKRFLAVLARVRGNDGDAGDALYRRVVEERRPGGGVEMSVP